MCMPACTRYNIIVFILLFFLFRVSFTRLPLHVANNVLYVIGERLREDNVELKHSAFNIISTKNMNYSIILVNILLGFSAA